MDIKPLVTIGIPAFNEEANIKKLLRSLLAQEHLNYQLKEIIVVSDASTDNTEKEVLSLQSEYIRLIRNEQRLGQQTSQNRIINLARGELIVLVNANTIPCNTGAVDELVKPFSENLPNLGLAVGSAVPIRSKNMIEEIVNYIYAIRMKTFAKWKKGNNIFVTNGKAMRAISRNFAIKLFWPNDTREDAYLYLRLRQSKMHMVKRRNACVFFRNVNTFSDYVNERIKNTIGLKNVIRHFPEDLVMRELTFPRSLFFQMLLREMFEKPLLMLGSIILVTAAKYAMKGKKEFSALHDPFISTKNLSRI